MKTIFVSTIILIDNHTNSLYKMIKMFALAVLPVILLAGFILYKDRKRPEPAGKLLKSFFYGVLSVFVTLMIVPIFELFVDINSETWISKVNNAFWGAAIPEEAAKLFMLWLVLRKNKYFDEYFDGIVYAVMVGLGFACFENILYVVPDSDWVKTGIIRALMAVPGHYAYAVFMGYFYSKAHFGNGASRFNLIMAFIVPVILHGLYDMFLMVAEVMPDFINVLLVLCCWTLCYFMHKAAIKLIANHLQADTMRAEEDSCEIANNEYEENNENENQV